MATGFDPQVTTIIDDTTPIAANVSHEFSLHPEEVDQGDHVEEVSFHNPEVEELDVNDKKSRSGIFTLKNGIIALCLASVGLMGLAGWNYYSGEQKKNDQLLQDQAAMAKLKAQAEKKRVDDIRAKEAADLAASAAAKEDQQQSTAQPANKTNEQSASEKNKSVVAPPPVSSTAFTKVNSTSSEPTKVATSVSRTASNEPDKQIQKKKTGSSWFVVSPD